MSTRPCTNACEGCPLVESGQFADKHHLAYPAFRYKTPIEKKWRDLPLNTVDICRCLHNAIHATGYVPEKPSRDEMLTEIWAKEPTERSAEERNRQLFLGALAIERGGELPPEDAA